MKEYLVHVMGVVILVCIGEMFLPEGNLKKYSGVIFGLLLCAAMLSPLSAELDIELFPQIQSEEAADTFESEVQSEYTARLEGMIEEKSGVRARITLAENFSLLGVELFGTPSGEGMNFIINELGVSRDEIEIREN